MSKNGDRERVKHTVLHQNYVELHKRYGLVKVHHHGAPVWRSVKVWRSLIELTAEHFQQEIREEGAGVVYNSKRLQTSWRAFQSDSGINVMVKSRARFNASGADN